MRVAALMLLDDKVVLVRHRAGSAVYHLLPGGGVEWGESLQAALLREVAEETGLECEVGSPAIINDTIAPDGSRHVVNITFSCVVSGGQVTESPSDRRVEAVDLVAPDDLVDLDLRPPIADVIADTLRAEVPVARYAGALYAPERLP